MGDGDQPWTERFRPKSIRQIIGNQEAIQRLKTWLESWDKGIPPKRAILLVGPPGVGKTSVIGALARDLDVELVEFNASDKRNRTVIETQVWRSATQHTITGRQRMILLDEIDGMSGTGDRGGVAAVIEIIEQTVHPVIMTANDEESTAVKELRSKKICEVIRFQAVSVKEIMTVLSGIVKDLHLEIEEETLRNIAASAGGDIRAAISDLESVADGAASTNITGLPLRNMQNTVQAVLGKIFMANDASAAKRIVSEADIDYEELLLWLEKNLPTHLVNDIELEEGFETLSAADLYIGRMTMKQNWQLLSYVYDLLSAGIALSRTITPFRRVEYEQPDWPLLVWQGNRSKDKITKLLSKLAPLLGVSQERAMRIYLDTIRKLVENSEHNAVAYANWLGVNKTLMETRRGH